jgi:hypothetical protein
MRRLLWIGDAACASGFAKGTHGVCNYLDYRANPVNPNPWDVTILGINHRGDPTPEYAYPIYTAAAGGDMFGVLRTVWMCDLVKPDAIAIQQDPWNFPGYMRRLKPIPEYADVPVIGFVAVDGLNCRGTDMNDLAMAIFYTQFGEQQARLGGFTKPSAVVSLGVDTTTFTPGDRTEARRALKLPDRCLDGFIVGNVNRNQVRKRLDLSIRYFSKWWHQAGCPKNAWLYLHVAPTGETGYNLKQLAAFYGIYRNIIISESEAWSGSSDLEMVHTYRAFDVQITTTQGEGDGLTTKEGMASAIPQIAPDWAALGEWARGAALLVECSSTAATIGKVNAIGGIADEDQFVEALDMMYSDPQQRHLYSQLALRCAQRPQYQWPEVGRLFSDAVDRTLFPATVPTTMTPTEVTA